MAVLQPYVPLVFMLLLVGGFAVFSVVVAPAGPHVGPRRYNRAKLDACKCGVEPSPQLLAGGGRASIDQWRGRVA